MSVFRHKVQHFRPRTLYEMFDKSVEQRHAQRTGRERNPELNAGLRNDQQQDAKAYDEIFIRHGRDYDGDVRKRLHADPIKEFSDWVIKPGCVSCQDAD